MKIKKNLYKAFLKLMPRKFYDSYINFTIHYLKGIDVLTYAYNNIGILKWQDFEISGEKFVIEKIIKSIEKSKPIIFDVGANIGDYSNLISKIIPKATIFSFEPNPITFEILKTNIIDFNNIHIYNVGFSSNNTKCKLYSYKDFVDSGHASLYENHKEVINEELSKREIISFDVELINIDSFCEKKHINFIDYLKLDIEGHELEALRGAVNMLRANRIGIIQFEFNVANIVSKTFLKDFYDLLYPKYEFYRIDTYKLIPLGGYDAKNEIFQIQNILLINKNIKLGLDSKYFL